MAEGACLAAPAGSRRPASPAPRGVGAPAVPAEVRGRARAAGPEGGRLAECRGRQGRCSRPEDADPAPSCAGPLGGPDFRTWRATPLPCWAPYSPGNPETSRPGQQATQPGPPPVPTIEVSPHLHCGPQTPLTSPPVFSASGAAAPEAAGRRAERRVGQVRGAEGVRAVPPPPLAPHAGSRRGWDPGAF